MLQSPCKTLGFKTNMVYKFPLGVGGGGVNHIQPVAYIMFVLLSRLFIAALWSPVGKGLTFRLLFVKFNNCVFFTFQRGILGQV